MRYEVWDMIPKGETYLLATELRRKNPCMSIVEIANRTGVSRQRVDQILKDAGLTSRRYIQKKLYECWQCGKSTKNKKFCSNECKLKFGMVELECYWCGNRFDRKVKDVLNRPNSASRNRQHYYCSKGCRNDSLVSQAKLGVKLVTLTCTGCGKEFTRNQSIHRKRVNKWGHFCNYGCFNSYVLAGKRRETRGNR